MATTLAAMAICITGIVDVTSHIKGFSDPSSLTSTFYATMQNDAAVGWPISTKHILVSEGFSSVYQKNWSTNHYYECMAEAQLGGSVCSSVTESNGFSFIQNYISCLKNNTQTAAVLASCSLFSTQYYFQWPTKDQYSRCLAGNPVMVSGNGQRWNYNTFKGCLSRIDWPFYEVALGVDSELFLGSYNWLVLCVIGLSIMTSFSVFTVSIMENGVGNHNRPDFMAKMGLFWSGLSFLWNTVILIVFTAYVFRKTTVFQSTPVTLWTAVLGMFTLGAAWLYFFDEFFSNWTFRDLFSYTKVPTGEGHQEPEATLVFDHGRQHHSQQHHNQHHHNPDHRSEEAEADESGPVFASARMKTRVPGLGMYIPHNTWPGNKKSDSYDYEYLYTPPLITSWSDAYFADGLILVGLAGATGQ
jgi:hypothetical protein